MDKVSSKTPKKQHYVPQFLLKNFSYGKKYKIFAFDKAKVVSFGTCVRDSASENGFYNLTIDGETHTLEHKLSKLESICAEVIKKICRDESFENLTNDDHMILCVFVTNILIRVKKQREFLWQLNTGIAEWLQNMGLDPNKVSNFNTLEKDDVNRQHVQFTNEQVFDLSMQFYEKPIALLKAPNGSNFIISDNPVTIYNHWNREDRGNKGISVPGVEIQIPLSNKLCLSFICPSLFADITEKLEFLANYKGRDLTLHNIDTSYAKILICSIKEGKAVQLNKEQVKFSNSLQIADSLKYIYSDKNDFQLAKDMVLKNPNLANGKVMYMGL